MTYLPNISYDLLDPNNTTSAEFAKIRSDLLVKLTGLGAESIEIQYSADEVTAQVETISVLPATASITEDLRHRAAAFGLDFTYSVNPGVKHSLGNQGSLTWDLLSDSIDIFHSETYFAVEDTEHEGL